MTTTYTANNVKEKTTTEGFLGLNLDGAADGSQTFYAGVGDGANVIYTICDEQNFILEIGVGTLTHGTPDVLSRNILPIYSITESSPGVFALVNLPVGNKVVHIGPVAGIQYGDFKQFGNVEQYGDVNFYGNSIINATDVAIDVVVGEGIGIDLALGYTHNVPIDPSTFDKPMIILNHPVSGKSALIKIILTIDSIGGYAPVSLPAGFTPINAGVAPIINMSANAVNIIYAMTYNGGSTWYYWMPVNGEGDQAATILTQDGGGDISIDLKPKRNGYYFDLNVNGHLNAPINQVAGQEFNIVVFQATSGACTLTAAADFKFGTAGLSVDTTLNSTTVIKCIVAYDGYIMSRVYKEV